MWEVELVAYAGGCRPRRAASTCRPDESVEVVRVRSGYVAGMLAAAVAAMLAILRGNNGRPLSAKQLSPSDASFRSSPS